MSRVKDPYGGLVLSLEGDLVEMDVAFESLEEPDRLAGFKECLRALGHTAVTENPQNIGLGQESGSLDLEYLLPCDLATLREVVGASLDFLQGAAGDVVYVHAWRSQDGPDGTGIKVRPWRDVLSQVP